jgi:dihydroflavonol-4-reductase
MGTAVVTGASGLVGGNLALLLAREGHRVRALFRSEKTVAHLGNGLAFVKGDLEDPASLRAAFAGADVVFHCAAVVSVVGKPTPALVRANVDGTAHVIDAVRAAGVKRLVHCSSTVTVGIATGAAPVDESAPWNMAARGLDDGYAVTKKRAEELVQRAAAADVDAVIVNPGFMFGPYDAKPSSGRLLVELVRGRVPAHTPGANSFVDVRDVTRGMIQAWHRGRRGERYILGGHNLPYRTVFETVARLAGVRPPWLALPRALALALGFAGELAGTLTGREPFVSASSVRWSFEPGFRVSSAKATAELGYSISPLEPALADALEWFRAHGMLPPAPMEVR